MIPKININDYNYVLPAEKIALYPLENRDESKLQIINRADNSFKIDKFSNLHKVIDNTYHLVFNNTKVIPARFYMERKNNKIVEIFCLNPILPSIDPQISLLAKNKVTWNCILKGKKIKIGDEFKNISKEYNTLRAKVLDIIESHFTLEFNWTEDASFFEIINSLGQIPLPPYIERDLEESDKTRYQTVFAKEDGSVAAPTAALHFTDNVFKNLKENNITYNEILLHVGAGTFKPLFVELVEEHPMHEEFFSVSLEFLEDLICQVKSGKKILAVGTTSVRTLESLMIFSQKLLNSYEGEVFIEQWEAYEMKFEDRLILLNNLKEYMMNRNLKRLIGYTQLIIVPSYKFKIVDTVITNFHQPYSTLILLTAAFMGDDLFKEAYQFALENDFRFLSYGDSSIIL
jgi:S-adenosylmethionine:tRNA ribosyltransferase-isomerase